MKVPCIVFLFVLCTYFILYSAPYEVFVSPSGNDSNPGTEKLPLKSLNYARDNAVANKNSDGTVLTLLGGIYRVNSSFIISSKHSGLKNAPFKIHGKSGDTAILLGAVSLKYATSKPCDESDIASGIDPNYVSKIRKWYFKDLGITDTGFWSMTNIKNELIPQLYYNDSLMPLAQWPDTGYATIDSVLPSDTAKHLSKVGYTDCNFISNAAPIHKIYNEIPHAFMYGYWFWDWYENYELIESVDTLKHVINAALPYNSPYDYRKGQRFYIGNLFCQLNKIGEWAIDPTKKILYFWPPEKMDVNSTFISTNNSSVISLNKSSFVSIENLIIKNTVKNAINITACSSIVISECAIHGIGGKGIHITNSVKNRIQNCEIYNIGRSVITIFGGNRDSLLSSDNIIANNKIHDFQIIKKTFLPAVLLDFKTIGCKITCNTIYNSSHSAIIFWGNNHLIEHNYIYNVCSETQDAGAIYTGRDWSARGTVIRNNFIENCGIGDVNAIYLDDLASGITIYDNIIKNVPVGIKIGGGRDNRFLNNTVINPTKWIKADSRGLSWANMWVVEEGTCPTRLASVPYQDSIWSQIYPALLTILDDNPGYPKGNIAKGNTLINSNGSFISEENIQFGIFDSNITINSLSFHTPLNNYGIQKGMNVDTISSVPLFRMPVIPLVRNVFTQSGTFYIACVPSYHSKNLKARAINISNKKIYEGNGIDTVKFPGLIPGDYIYDLWYTDIPYQDSTFTTHDTVHLSKDGLSSEAIFPQLKNNYILGGTGIDSTTISLFWNSNNGSTVDSIGIWYSESGYPVKPYDSNSMKAGVWTIETTEATITGLKADKVYYFSLFTANKEANWSNASDLAQRQIKTDPYIEPVDSQPENGYILTGVGADSSTIALSWICSVNSDDDIDSIGIWYNEFSYPGMAYDSNSAKAGVWTVETTETKIINLKPDKLYYFSLFVIGKDGIWSIAPDSARKQIRTGLGNGKSSGYEIILQGSDATSLFSDSLKIWSDEIAVPYIDTIDRLELPKTDGFIVIGPSFAFRSGRAPTHTNVYFSVNFNNPQFPYCVNDIKVYRFNIYTDAWRLDTVSLVYNVIENTIQFSTSDLALPFALLIDTLPIYLSAYTNDTSFYEVYEPIYDTFTITDNIENPHVKLLAGSGVTGYSDISFKVASSKQAGSGVYVSTIPAFIADPASGLRALLIVSDERSGDTINLSRKIRRSGTNCDDISMPEMEWTPFSVTAKPENSSLSDVFSNTFGIQEYKYDNREQRILRWLPNESDNKKSLDKWIEYNQNNSDDFAFIPGRLFWMKTKSRFTISYGVATIPALIDTFKVTLKKGEWSEFSLPYNFDIYTGDVLNATAQYNKFVENMELYEWVKSENSYYTKALYLPGIDAISDPEILLKAGGAFTVFNNSNENLILRIPPVCTGLSVVPKGKSAIKKISQMKKWSIKVSFKDEKQRDLAPVYCSAIPDNNIPRFYHTAPTFIPISAGIQDLKSGIEYGHAAIGDLSSGGTYFNIFCHNQSERSFVISTSIDDIRGLPSNIDTKLLWTNSNNGSLSYSSNNITIAPKQKNTGYLIVGSNNYISEFIRNINTKFSFKTFTVNNLLKIRYTLPVDVKKMTISIVDLKGRFLDRFVLTENLYMGEGDLILNKKFCSGYYIVRIRIEKFDNAIPCVLNNYWMFVQ